MADDTSPEGPADAAAGEPTAVPDVAAEASAEPVALDEAHQDLLARLEAALGDAIVETGVAVHDLVVRVRRDAWRQAGEACRRDLDCDYLSFIAGIDWLPTPRVAGDDAAGDTSSPVQPTEQTPGIAGSDGRFQVFAVVGSTARHWWLTLKTDLDEADPRVESWVPVYPGADWHERECWEMYGIVFDGHPSLRHIYLPAEFEGFPLRKDFPLLAREVKPWPGLVDVEGMPGEAPGAAEEVATT